MTTNVPSNVVLSPPSSLPRELSNTLHHNLPYTMSADMKYDLWTDQSDLMCKSSEVVVRQASQL